MNDSPLRQLTPPTVLKGARPAGSVTIEPRPPLTLGAPPDGDLDGGGLQGLHDSLGQDTDHPSAVAERAADRILAEARAHRESLLNSAAEEAQAAKAQMERELAAMQEAAELELAEQRVALVDGLRREIEQEFSGRYGAALEQLERAAGALAEQQARYVAEIEQPALQLVLCIARQLLGGELSRSPEFLARLIGDALTQLRPQPAAQVSLNPATLELLLRDELLASVLRTRGINLDQVELQAASNLRPDQFELHAGMALISFDLQQKAAELTAALEERAASGSASRGDSGQ
jgi:flagellar biosynthesis/type III secretory pathway protein FliH